MNTTLTINNTNYPLATLSLSHALNTGITGTCMTAHACEISTMRLPLRLINSYLMVWLLLVT